MKSQDIEAHSISVKEASIILNDVLESNIPVFLWGPPGIGKSSIVKQIAEKRDISLVDIRLTLLNPIDLRGLPTIDESAQSAKWFSPDFLPKNGSGILFLDELNVAPTATQQAAYQLMLDRKIGEYTLPENWHIVAAGNREVDQAFVNVMPKPLANRMIHLEVKPTYEDFKLWAIKKNKEGIPNITEEVLSFLSRFEQYLNVEPKKEEKAFPTPRSWYYVSSIIRLYKNRYKQEVNFFNKIINSAYYLIAGAVGAGVAGEFITYFRVYETMPDPDLILNGKEHRLPEKNNIDQIYALITSLVYKANKENVDHLMAYIIRFEDAEWTARCILDIVNRVQVDGEKDMIYALKYNKDFINWSKNNSNKIVM